MCNTRSYEICNVSANWVQQLVHLLKSYDRINVFWSCHKNWYTTVRFILNIFLLNSATEFLIVAYEGHCSPKVSVLPAKISLEYLSCNHFLLSSRIFPSSIPPRNQQISLIHLPKLKENNKADTTSDNRIRQVLRYYK